jgi:hypothetical protein
MICICGYILQFRQNPLPRSISHGLALVPDDTPRHIKDMKIILTFLDEVARVFVQDRGIVPRRSIRANQDAPRSYFAFTADQINDLRHALACGDVTPTAENNARKALIPLFMRLNSYL